MEHWVGDSTLSRTTTYDAGNDLIWIGNTTALPPLRGPVHPEQAVPSYIKYHI